MKDAPTITIAGAVFRRNPAVDRYQIPFGSLGDLRMMDIPPHSHVEVTGLPVPEGVLELEVFGVNNGDEGTPGHLSVYGGASYKVSADEKAATLARLRRAFPESFGHVDAYGNLRAPEFSVRVLADGLLVSVNMCRDYGESPQTLMREAVMPYQEGLRRLSQPAAHAFICHASEDKEMARQVAAALRGLGTEVWLDEWEIRVGDSIVEKIDRALGAVTHLVVLMSEASVQKPWVRKELSSALFQQLSKQSITVLPVRLDDCRVPPILADIKYADARNSLESAVVDLRGALLDGPDADDESGL